MATAARDRLARTLRGDAKTAFSVELAAKTDDLSLEVEGFGSVKFPVTPARARKLLGLGQFAEATRRSIPAVGDGWPGWVSRRRHRGLCRCHERPSTAAAIRVVSCGGAPASGSLVWHGVPALTCVP